MAHNKRNSRALRRTCRVQQYIRDITEGQRDTDSATYRKAHLLQNTEYVVYVAVILQLL